MKSKEKCEHVWLKGTSTSLFSNANVFKTKHSAVFPATLRITYNTKDMFGGSKRKRKNILNRIFCDHWLPFKLSSFPWLNPERMSALKRKLPCSTVVRTCDSEAERSWIETICL